MYPFALALSVVVWLGVGFIYLRQHISSIFHPMTIYLALHGIFFVIRPILAYQFNYSGLYQLYGFTPTVETKTIVIMGATLGLLSFSVTNIALSTRVQLFAGVTPISYATRRRLLRNFLIVAMLCLPLAIYSMITTVDARAEGVSSMNMIDGVYVNTEQNGYFLVAKMMIGPLTCIFAWLCRFRLWSLLPFLAFAMFQFSTGGRFPVIYAALSLGMLYYADRERRWPRVHALLVWGSALLTIFIFVGDDRGQFLRQYLLGVEGTRQVNYFAKRPLEGMDYANMEFFEYLVTMIPDRTQTYGYFLNNLQIFTEPVPRILWPEKPIGAPIQLYNLWDYGTPIGMTNSLPGEGWAQLGWIGIVIWCALWGAIYAYVYNRFVQARMSPFALIVYTTVLPIEIHLIRDGLLVVQIKDVLFILMPILLWLVLDKMMPGGLLMPSAKQRKAMQRPHPRQHPASPR